MLGVGLFGASGFHWKSSRRALNPAFSIFKIKQMAPLMQTGCDTLVTKFEEESKSQQSVDVTKLFANFTMETVIAAAFGQRVEVQQGESSVLVKAASEFLCSFQDNGGLSLAEFSMLLSQFPILPRLLGRLMIYLKSTQALKTLRRASLQLVAARRQQTSPPQVKDLLQLLLDTTMENEDGTRESLSNEQIVAFASNFFVAGTETTATVLSTTSYLLALHPDIQERLQSEIDSYLKNNPVDGSLYEAAQNIEYLDTVIQVSMRLYPTVALMYRRCGSTIKVNDVTIPQCAGICIPILLVHKNPLLWPEPNKFDPERFTAKEKKKRPKLAHMPFGLGPHNCLGMMFALLEAKMALIGILQRFTFVQSPETEMPLQISHGAAATPRNGVWLQISSR